MKHTGIERRDKKWYAFYSEKYLGCFDSLEDAKKARETYLSNRKYESRQGKRYTLDIFNERLKEVVYASGMDISTISRRTGISRKMLYEYMQKSLPTAGALAKIAIALNVSVDYLLGLKEEKNAEFV